MNLTNLEYNFLKSKLNEMIDAYKQSNDPEVHAFIREQTINIIATSFPEIAQLKQNEIKKFQMKNLNEITGFNQKILENILVVKLPTITEKELKKQIKAKFIPKFVKAYNEAIANNNLTYYSLPIDQNLIIIKQIEGTPKAVIANVKPNKALSKTLCAFCNQFRPSGEVGFITNTNKQNNTIGFYACLDSIKCNESITSESKLNDFINY